jgi:hypothetical protein
MRLEKASSIGQDERRVLNVEGGMALTGIMGNLCGRMPVNHGYGRELDMRGKWDLVD